MFFHLISLNANHHKLNHQIIVLMQVCFQMKLAILEQKLLKEEHERKLVQEKADEVSGNALSISKSDFLFISIKWYLVGVKVTFLVFNYDVIAMS